MAFGDYRSRMILGLPHLLAEANHELVTFGRVKPGLFGIKKLLLLIFHKLSIYDSFSIRTHLHLLPTARLAV